MEAYKPSKAVIKEHEGQNSFPIIRTSNDNKQAFKKVEKQHSKSADKCPSDPIFYLFECLLVIIKGSNDRELILPYFVP